MQEQPGDTNPAQRDHAAPRERVSSAPEKHGPAMNQEQFRELLKLAREGSAHALGELIEGNQRYLLLIANQDVNANLQAKIGASDVVQETLAAAHQNIDKFKGHSPEELKGWLRAILKNQILALTRQYSAAKRDVRREGPVSDAAPMRDLRPTPRTTAADLEEARRLRQAMERLSAEHRRVIMLRNWEQLEFAEVGRRMNRSVEAVKKLWARAFSNLKKELIRETQQGPN
jgi:RNA polymerase sigma-70 factor (ECF subfamily)